jgi:hypothetical protein
MTKKKKIPRKPVRTLAKSPASEMGLAVNTKKRAVRSMLDEMVDGNEYGSIVGIIPMNLDLRDEIRRAISEIEVIRKRPLLMYAANIFKPLKVSTSIDGQDDLPFSEMLSSVPDDQSAIDILLVTPGGQGSQVAKFVANTRSLFDDVSFLVPHAAMSAGTLWALSGNEIVMDERAVLGPIDPQALGRDGRLLPAQALLGLLEQIQREGDDAIAKGESPKWTHIQLLKNIDAKEIGNAIAMTDYSVRLAAEFLEKYKFAGWMKHSNGDKVTPEERKKRAEEISGQLGDHLKWKVHGHGISREILRSELRLKIIGAEEIDGLERAIRRLWALLYWAFDSSKIAKLMISKNYSLFRSEPVESTK